MMRGVDDIGILSRRNSYMIIARDSAAQHEALFVTRMKLAYNYFNLSNVLACVKRMETGDHYLSPNICPMSHILRHHTPRGLLLSSHLTCSKATGYTSSIRSCAFEASLFRSNSASSGASRATWASLSAQRPQFCWLNTSGNRF